MRYTPHPTHSHSHVGLFELDAADTQAQVAAAVVAERDRVFPWRDNAARMRDHIRDERLGDRTEPAPSFPTYPEGDDVVRHSATIDKAITACERAGLEFWALGRFGRIWGVKDGRYYELGRYAGAREVAPDHGRYGY